MVRPKLLFCPAGLASQSGGSAPRVGATACGTVASSALSPDGPCRRGRCGPCRQVFPHLSQVARSHAPQGLVVVGVSLEPVSPQLQAFVQQQGSNMEYAVRCGPAAPGRSAALTRAQ